MNGKQHIIIGGVCGIGCGFAMYGIVNNFHSLHGVAESVKSYVPVVSCTLGAIAGALWVDIDSKKSKASQEFTKAVMYMIWAYALLFLFRQDMLKSVLGYSYGALKSNFLLVSFVALTTLGKMSPHRGFTHKILGTVAFCLVGYFLLPQFANVGFVIGYVSHLLADKTTPEGLDVFELRLPLMNSEGELKIHF